ncbi:MULTISPECIES: OPT family oligopeptide transporter [unclassified Halanaerobium]|uniref:OPT family oligopeptide transporter n=1 Tax=unclassified Halanaerobium TaxID=2641197 RepID=UPI000DF3252A|nr:MULTISPECIES: oligopeptide transporter, OPT family [unclassified Halanaerobium]RCW48164.1 putative OPT family oligopeptide transporter [Halanaerobium sp. MA284_MarDTE_T2]RCW80426.1 putative OPT family oligopeptide transporter [Halanaerobium sp. DL-01]
MSDNDIKGLDPNAYEEIPGEEYQPYVAAETVMPEFTITSIILGIIMTIIFGAANAYLGLKVGMTVSASVPAAVISMGVIRGILKRDSILENNMVQTISSAGESVAAGVIFTIPALIIWGVDPSIFKMFLLALLGGLVGVLFMIPLRKHLIVGEHGRLPYPEGTACAEVLVAGEKGGVGAKTVFTGLGVGALYKILGEAKGFNIWPTRVEWGIPGIEGAAIGMDILPALLGVGFIIGPRISALMFSGGVMGWLVFIPLMTLIGKSGTPIYPANVPISELGYWGIWDNYIRYIGAGAVALGGIISLIKALPTIWDSFKAALSGLTKNVDIKSNRTSEDLPLKWVLSIAVAIIILIAVMPQIPVGIWGAIFVLIFGFFFVTVSSRIVGIVGSSSNPASGMTIATLLFTTALFKALGWSGESGMIAALSVGAIVCIAIAVAGDTSQDLKTGFLVGATPRKQQLGEMLGVLISALVIGFVLLLLHEAYTIGSKDLAAPQATLMSMVVEGVMKGTLPWTFIFIGAFSAVIVELFGIRSLPFAVGLYLPIHLSAPIIIGGLIKGILNKQKDKNQESFERRREKGVLYASGLIAGDAVMGVVLAIFAYFKLSFGFRETPLGPIWGLIFFASLVITLIYNSILSKNNSSSINE